MSNVAVCVRIRPLSEKEAQYGSMVPCIRRSDQESFTFKDDKEEESVFTFDRVFYEDSIQADVFEFVAKPIVKDAMNAINGTILAYGQTGAGKTHTMEGPNMQNLDDSSSKGILPRVAQCIFEFIQAADETSEFLIKLSMVEIYMEKIRDLLDATKNNLQVKENRAKGIFIAGVTEVGLANRAVGATQMNAESSRSHCVFLFTIQQTNSEDRSMKTGKVYLVDLAGSEKVERTGAEGKLLSEAKMINKSLSALGNVINALTSETGSHVPYRDSKLTRILQESLGGNSRTTLLCCCSPSSLHVSETLSTLRFGSRAKQIRNKPKVNAERGRHELEQLLQKSEYECEQLRGQVLILNARLQSVTEGNKILTPSNISATPGNPLEPRLRAMLSKKVPPRLDEVIAALQEIFIKEGLLGTGNANYFPEFSTGDIILDLPSLNSDILTTEKGVNGGKQELPDDNIIRTIVILQNSLEDLTEQLDKVTRENEGLKMELGACMHLLKVPSPHVGIHKPISGCKAEGKCSVGKPLIVRPVRGGNDRICELGSCQEVQILDKCDSTQIKWYWWRSLASKLMQNASSLLKRYGFYTSLQRCCAR
ncbi:unnamed protein product [Sphagnum jensenii]|uniref:Kinesin-like protein n=1 Tax=Sphagnum jensenii TaxID=128206 RepID=A0ABP0WNB6_9BRYO